ncbi:hypothetical protein IHE45_11G024300 [Dioscorea alata]|uniref:Uncharacterized protein n=1 Tax=Dioscorea alata TaxID=55571 RepID=A0ACB7V5C1_DIOAL|nr:hypothetical protein IHE45_11G024300 [Dioscorea alata]
MCQGLRCLRQKNKSHRYLVKIYTSQKYVGFLHLHLDEKSLVMSLQLALELLLQLALVPDHHLQYLQVRQRQMFVDCELDYPKASWNLDQTPHFYLLLPCQ